MVKSKTRVFSMATINKILADTRPSSVDHQIVRHIFKGILQKDKGVGRFDLELPIQV